MKVGLYNLEQSVINPALMRVSYYHKQLGNEVEFYNHFEHDKYDKIYAFSIFDYTDKGYVTKDMICGGTGFKNQITLEDLGINDYFMDYSMYPDCDFSYLWFSRGCPRKCDFCVIPKREGKIKPLDVNWNLNLKGKYIKVMDNNFFANPNYEEAIGQLIEINQPVIFEQGIDIRILDENQCQELDELRLHKQLRISWDNPKQDITPKLDILTKYIKPYKIMCYVLINYNSTPEEDLYRVNKLKEWGIDPYIMTYGVKNQYTKDFSRWVNHKAIFNSTNFDEYKVKK